MEYNLEITRNIGQLFQIQKKRLRKQRKNNERSSYLIILLFDYLR
jgi:hypothetical protein